MLIKHWLNTDTTHFKCSDIVDHHPDIVVVFRLLSAIERREGKKPPQRSRTVHSRAATTLTRPPMNTAAPRPAVQIKTHAAVGFIKPTGAVASKWEHVSSEGKPTRRISAVITA